MQNYINTNLYESIICARITFHFLTKIGNLFFETSLISFSNFADENSEYKFTCAYICTYTTSCMHLLINLQILNHTRVAFTYIYCFYF